MLSTEKAMNFAKEWIDAWNSHDLERILGHYTDDFEMTTPFIVKLLNHPTGTLKGKETIKTYWEKALTLLPNMKIEVTDISNSIDSIALSYKALGKKVTETLFFNDSGKINKSIQYLSF
jgi:hypothetical protein